jgi:phospholipid/cholesterol/gamma-HCH transport system ATP-binding protein
MNGVVPAVELRGIDKTFDGHPVFRGLDLAVRTGETLAVLGPSGSGKSVLLRLIIGLQRAEHGTIEIEGAPLQFADERALRAVRRKVGLLFQSAALFDSLTVGENVAYGLRELPDWSPERERARVAECLAWVGLPGLEAALPGALSGGMRKRVGLARAIAPGPRVILYDEPTTGLDPGNSRRIDELIRSLQQRLGVTSIVITHDIASALAVADRVALIVDKKIPFVVTQSEAQSSPPPALASFIRGEISSENGRE